MRQSLAPSDQPIIARVTFRLAGLPSSTWLFQPAAIFGEAPLGKEPTEKRTCAMVRQDIVDGKGAISFGRKKAKHVFLLRNVRNEIGASEVF